VLLVYECNLCKSHVVSDLFSVHWTVCLQLGIRMLLDDHEETRFHLADLVLYTQLRICGMLVTICILLTVFLYKLAQVKPNSETVLHVTEIVMNYAPSLCGVMAYSQQPI